MEKMRTRRISRLKVLYKPTKMVTPGKDITSKKMANKVRSRGVELRLIMTASLKKKVMDTVMIGPETLRSASEMAKLNTTTKSQSNQGSHSSSIA